MFLVSYTKLLKQYFIKNIIINKKNNIYRNFLNAKDYSRDYSQSLLQIIAQIIVETVDQTIVSL